MFQSYNTVPTACQDCNAKKAEVAQKIRETYLPRAAGRGINEFSAGEGIADAVHDRIWQATSAARAGTGIDGPWSRTGGGTIRFLDLSMRARPTVLTFLEEGKTVAAACAALPGHVDVQLTLRRISGSDGDVTVDETLAGVTCRRQTTLQAATCAAKVNLTVQQLMLARRRDDCDETLRWMRKHSPRSARSGRRVANRPMHLSGHMRSRRGALAGGFECDWRRRRRRAGAACVACPAGVVEGIRLAPDRTAGASARFEPVDRRGWAQAGCADGGQMRQTTRSLSRLRSTSRR